MTESGSPSRLPAILRLTAETRDAHRHAWALVGGLAVSVRAEPRFTRDIDVAVAVADDAGAEALVGALLARGFRLLLSPEHQALGRLAAVRLTPPGEPEEGVVVDLHALIATLDEADRARARDGVARIQALGANRSKRLADDLEHWLRTDRS